MAVPNTKEMTMKNTVLNYLPVVIAGAFTAMIYSPSADAGSNSDLKLSGSSTVAPLMLEVGKKFEKENGSVRVFVESGGSSKGIADLRKGLNDIAMISRDLNPNEQDLAAHVIARDGIAVVVHKNNPVSKLSVEQIRGIFNGTFDNWKQVGGADQKLVVISKAEGRATFVVFNKHLNLKASEIDADLIVGENAQMIKTLSAVKQGIGYVSIGAAQVDIDLGSPMKLISMSDVEPTVENVSNGSYEPTRTLNLITKNKVRPSAKLLISYSRSPAVTDLIGELTFSPAKQ